MVIYTELRHLQSNGHSADEAVTKLETLRADRSIRQLINKLITQLFCETSEVAPR
jgi:hypothetical protein